MVVAGGLIITSVMIFNVVGRFFVGWVGVNGDGGGINVAMFGEEISVGGIFLIVVEEEGV